MPRRTFSLIPLLCSFGLILFSGGCRGTGALVPRFEGLGDLREQEARFEAQAVSSDGSVVVGKSVSDFGDRAVRWDGGTFERLDPPEGCVSSNARDVSADGSVVVGGCLFADGTRKAMCWQNGRAARLGPLEVNSWAQGVSVDGSVVVGSGKFVAEALRWENGRMVELGFLDYAGPLGSYSGASSVSADGGVVVGTSSSNGGNEAFLWKDGQWTGLGFLDGETLSDATAVSADGRVVVGSAFVPNGGVEAFHWQDGVMKGLGDLAGGRVASEAHAVSANGSIVVGEGYSDRGGEAFVWTELDGMQPLYDVLEIEYGLDLTGWRLWDAVDISDDGAVIVGNGTNPVGNPEAWLVVLAKPIGEH